MIKKDFFKKPDFQNRLDNANSKLSSYLAEKKYELNNLKIEELIQWHDQTPNGLREIYPNEKCPKDIRNIVADIIEKEFDIRE